MKENNVMTIEISETKEKAAVDQYGGNYIATADYFSEDVIAFGKNPFEVITEARTLGFDNPVINYIPPKGSGCLY